tara:strand:+ start:296 stop:760 length:465 start_codon:yes stop_codon:yes gene_type:complete
MAYLITNLDGYFLGIGKTEDHLRCIHGNYDHHYKAEGCVHEISDADYEAINLNHKHVIRNDDKSFTIEDHTILYNDHVDTITSEMHDYAGVLEYILKQYDWSPMPSFKTDVENYLELIKTFDYSTLTYPMTKTWNEHVRDENLVSVPISNHCAY